MRKSALIMAGGTGGHIYPGLAIAHALVEAGWTVTWLGGLPGTMEFKILAAEQHAGLQISYESVEFTGVRGKKLKRWLNAPFELLKALWQSGQVLRRVRPSVVIGMGGYITVPAGLMTWLLRKPLIIHEQNSIAGLSNRLFAKLTPHVLTAFPGALAGRCVGNPLRREFTLQTPPAARLGGRTGTLELLVIGGSLGAQGLNVLLPKALSLIPADQRPKVTHQTGQQQLESVQSDYLQHHVAASCSAYILDTAKAFAEADIIISRSGASTVTEIAAIGAAAFFVPFPHAVDDHQTSNAKYLVTGKAGQAGAWMEQQADLTPQMLADFLQTLTREEILAKATTAQQLAKLDAVAQVVATCESILQSSTYGTAFTEN
jgi:UDP-N-acetylglucosamine--N-acetylmuramyl-(pentapeptide) pyrophosphoryl-undecaprenol N-acetylglucosamine transferase